MTHHTHGSTTRRRRIAGTSALVLAAGGLAAAPAEAASPPGGPLAIRSVASGKCIDAMDHGTSNGTAVQQWDCASGSTAQTWKIQSIGGSDVRISLNAADSQVIDVSGLSKADGGVVHLWGYVQGANQQWTAVDNGDGSFSFRNRLSGKCLDVPSNKLGQNGVQLTQWSCHYQANQRFTLVAGGTTPPNTGGDLMADANKKRIAQSILQTAENSTLDTAATYAYIEDIGDERGYTGGIVGFTSRYDDMLKMVQDYVASKPSNNVMAKWVQPLKDSMGSGNTSRLGPAFERDWRTAAGDQAFRDAQDRARDRIYLAPAVRYAKEDGLGLLGQFIYFDAMVMHGEGGVNESDLNESFLAQRRVAMSRSAVPSRGGNETTYLTAFLNVRAEAMQKSPDHKNIDRVNAQRKFLNEKNFGLNPPLQWMQYGTWYTINN